MELKSLTQQSECAGVESGCLRILSECLGDSSMRLGVPFIAPRQLGAVEDNLGRLILPSVVWCTGQSCAPDSPVHHWTVIVAVRCAIAFQIRRSRPLQLRARWRTRHYLVHTGQSGAPCQPLVRATRCPRIARPAVTLTTVGSPDIPVHHRTVR
jgi:hypothetical protein